MTEGYLESYINEYYNEHITGGCLHIVLDDGNYEDEHVKFCVDYAIKRHDLAAEEIARELLKMNVQHRTKFLNRVLK